MDFTQFIKLFCAAGMVFLPGGIIGLSLLFYPHKWFAINTSFIKNFRDMDFDEEATMIKYRVFGCIFVFGSSIPFFVIFNLCILQQQC